MQSIHSSLAPGLDEYETLEGFQVHDVETSSILEEPQEAPEGANGLEGGDGQKRPWLTVYKEFFLSSFTANAYCCGAEGFFPAGLQMPSYGRKVAPIADPPSPITTKLGRCSPTASTTSSTRDSSSHESWPKPRNKPLGVAVGYKYAEDMNGRPVVITPGSRRTRDSQRHQQQTVDGSPPRPEQPLGDWNCRSPSSSPSLLFSSRSYTVDYTSLEKKTPVAYALSY